ncbi:MAG TPA: YdeI/OmpD-associated family protein [Candidatus Baltobacteraceae bacterium]|nr:YdeI/OmpD-associated family protein [Candidatus Baltobacteraceae bacterium]
MADEITFETAIEKDAGSAACGIGVPTADVVRWFGRKSRVPVVATINGYAYRSSLTPMGGRHVLPVNADVRREARVAAGDRVRLTLSEDRAERTIEVPDDLAGALGTAGKRAAFDAMSFTHRKEWVRAVLDAKRPETRAKRIADCVAAMRARSI